MNEKIVGVIVVIVAIAGGWYLLSRAPASSPPTTTTETPVTTTTTTTTSTTTIVMPPPNLVTVVYTSQGFSPASITITPGTTVTFLNQGTTEMWVASDPHPTHQGYDGTTRSQHCVTGYSGQVPFDQCSSGTSYSFTFLKAGTWGYHNHNSAGTKGNIIVTAPAAI